MGHIAQARYRLFRQKFRARRRRAALWALSALLKTRYEAHLKGRNVLMFSGRWIATLTGLALAGLFALTLPDDLLKSATLKVSEVHLASAGIIGTALALVLSLSIVPA
jgi:tetrahydromethanopterin S-methyltransferase subunit F